MVNKAKLNSFIKENQIAKNSLEREIDLVDRDGDKGVFKIASGVILTAVSMYAIDFCSKLGLSAGEVYTLGAVTIPAIMVSAPLILSGKKNYESGNETRIDNLQKESYRHQEILYKLQEIKG